MSEQTTVGVAPSAGLVLLNRYVLDDRVGGDDDASTWRGTDSRLRRAVAVQTLPLSDPRAEAVRDGARRAAAFDDRRAVPVLDFGEDKTSHLLVVVSEWVPGIGYGDYLADRAGDPPPPSEAADVALVLARCLAAAHVAGVGHGCLDPNALVITDNGEVRLRGLGIAGALASIGNDDHDLRDLVARDVHGTGSVLYAGLTGRWPSQRVGRLPAAARLPGGALPWPSRVVADVPPALDDITARSVVGCALPKGRHPFSDAAALTTALTSAVDAPAQLPAVPVRPVRGNGLRRALAVAFGIGLAVALGVAGVHLATGSLTKPTAGSTVTRSSTAPSTGSSPTAVVPRNDQVGVPVPIVAAVDFDPFGGDKRENPGLVPLAIDGDPATAWTTLQYNRANMSGKPGVGLRLDLGAPKTFSSVSLVLVGNGTDLQLRTGDQAGSTIKSYAVVASAIGAGDHLTLRIPGGVTARYLLVWLTKLPPSNSSFRGGIADVHVGS